jgi:intracellular septation protein A
VNSRLRSIVMIAVFDIAGPLVVYSLLRSAGFSTVSALVLSGVCPAIGVIIGIFQHRRVDAVGVLVLAGIAVGAILGLVSHNAKLVLDEGSVPTAVFGLICLGSLATRKPLIYRLAMEFVGADSRQGREFTDLWQYKEFRHVFRVMTTVWGTTYLAEAAARVVIVQNTSAGTALAISKVLPYAVAGVLVLWTVGYGRYQKRRGERQAAAAAAAAAAADSADASTASADASAASPATPASADARVVPSENQPATETLPAEGPRPDRP